MFAPGCQTQAQAGHSTCWGSSGFLTLNLPLATILHLAPFFYFRFNFSNKNEPYFVLDRLEKLSALMTLENNSLSAMVYALNQKGRSTPVLLQDFEIGRIQSYRGSPGKHPW